MKKYIVVLSLIFTGISYSVAQKLEFETIQINYLSALGLDSIGSNWGTPKSIPCNIDFTMDTHINVRVVDQEGKTYYRYDKIPYLHLDFYDNSCSISLGSSIEEISEGLLMISLRKDNSQINFYDSSYEDNEGRAKEIELKCKNIGKQLQIQVQMDLLLKNIINYKGETKVILENFMQKVAQ